MVSSGDDYYRAGTGRRVPAALLESAIFDHMNEEFYATELLDKFVAELKRAAVGLTADPTDLKRDLKRIDRQISNLLRLAEKAPDSSRLAERLRELEAERATVRRLVSLPDFMCRLTYCVNGAFARCQ
jgi:hypothetical protein